jgi:hypothetical protein
MFIDAIHYCYPLVKCFRRAPKVFECELDILQNILGWHLNNSVNIFIYLHGELNSPQTYYRIWTYEHGREQYGGQNKTNTS